MQIDITEASRRTLIMMAEFLHRLPSQVDLEDNLRKKWQMQDGDFPLLHIWIEGPITPPNPPTAGYFEDVAARVKLADLQDPQTVSTISSLVKVIWAGIPDENKLLS